MIDIKSKEAYYEVSKILKYTSNNLEGKVPSNLINYFEENKAEDHYFEVDPAKRIDEQKILPETNEILDILYRDYIYSEDYNQENLVENKIEEKENKIIQSNEINDFNLNNVTMIEYKETFFSKVMNKIRSLLWKINY